MKNRFPSNPYPGLRPFEFPENHLFFGREGQSEEVLRRLRESHFVAVVGTSGSGKSSLVRAGLLPLLYGGFMTEAGACWRVALFRPGDNPIHNLAAALVQPAQFTSSTSANLQTSETEELKLAVTETVLRRSAVGLRDYANGMEFENDENLLVVVDQFEELFRFKKENKSQMIVGASDVQEKAENEAAAFVKLLLEAAKETTNRVYVIITMRSDFLGDCSQFRDLPETINNGQYLIPRLTTEQLKKAIESPARVKGARIQPALVARLLNDIGDDQDQLPVLQHALMRTWDEWAKEGDKKIEINFDHYNATGGMATALAKHADEAFFELGDTGSEEPSRKQIIAEKLFKCLTETDRENRETRRATSLGKVCAIADAKIDEVISVINVFRQPGRTFLMPPFAESLDENTLIDISHESLIRKWDRLKKWVEEEAQSSQTYRRLAEDAWLNKKGKVGFWSDPELKDALEWKENFKPNATWAELYLKTWGNRYLSTYDEAITYLEESRLFREKQLSEEEAQRNREIEQERKLREAESEKALVLEKSAKRLKRYLYALAAMSLLMLAITGFAGFMWWKAQKNAEEARKNEENAGFFLRQTLENQDVINEQKKSLEEGNGRLEKINGELEDSKKSLEKSLEIQKAERQKAEAEKIRADEQTKKAKLSEAETKEALLLQEQLKNEADKARDNAITAKNEAVAAKNRADSAVKKAVDTNFRESLSRDGLTLLEQGENEEALKKLSDLLKKYYEEYKEAEIRKYPIAKKGVWWTYHNLGIVYSRLQNYEKAEESYKSALEILGEPENDDSNSSDQSLYSSQSFVQNISYLTVDPAIDRGRITTLRRLAQLRRLQSQNEPNFQKSQEFTGLAVETYLALIKILGSKQPSFLPEVYVELADSLSYLEKSYATAVDYYKLAEDIYVQKGDYAKQVYVLKKRADAALRNDLVGAEAFNLLEKVVNIQEDKMKLSPTNPEIADTYSEITNAYVYYGNGYDAEPYREIVRLINEANQRIDLCCQRPSDDDLSRPYTSYIQLADAYLKIGKCGRAEATYLYAINSLKMSRGTESLKFYAITAEFYQKVLKNDSKAESYFAEVAKNQEQERNDNGVDLGVNQIDSYLKAGEFYFKKGDYDKAQELFEYALAGIANRIADFKEDDDRIVSLIFQQAEIFIKIAKIYEAQNKIPEAEAKYLEGLDLIDKKLGNLSGGAIKSQTADYLYQLGEFYERKNQAEKGRVAYRRAYQVVMGELFSLLAKGQQARIEIKLATPENKLQREFFLSALKSLLAYETMLNSPKQQNNKLREYSRYSEKYTLTAAYYSDLAEVYEALAKLETIESKKNTYTDLAKKQREKVEEIKTKEENICK